MNSKYNIISTSKSKCIGNIPNNIDKNFINKSLKGKKLKITSNIHYDIDIKNKKASH